MKRIDALPWIGAILLAIVIMFAPKDDTDPPKGRSGLRLYKDNLTGCEYIRAGWWGDITPRLDANGKQICKGGKL